MRIMVTRVKVGAILSMMLGLMWAATGLLGSLSQIATGLAVAAAASAVYIATSVMEGQ